jgi:hypothetical protein
MINDCRALVEPTSSLEVATLVSYATDLSFLRSLTFAASVLNLPGLLLEVVSLESCRDEL